MEHVDAEKEGIAPKVHFWFRQGSEKFDDSRQVPGLPPEAARRVIPHIKVEPVIRGHDLRKFTESASPGERYKDLARWFSLGSLPDIQKKLRALRRKVKEAAESTSEKKERLHTLKSVTGNKISDWDEAGVRDWFNETVMASLGSPLALPNLSEDSAEFQELVRLERDEREQVGLAQLRQHTRQIETVLGVSAGQDGSVPGQIAEFEDAVLVFRRAAENEKSKRSEASDAVFEQVWADAQKLFESDADFDSCPICGTIFSSTLGGSRAGVHSSLHNRLANLTEYSAAKTDLEEAKDILNATALDLKNALENLSSLLGASGYECAEMPSYLEALRSWDTLKEPPESVRVAKALAGISSSAKEKIAQIEQDQGENTYAKALKTAQDLIQIRADLERIARSKTKLKEIEDGILRQTDAIDKAIMGRVQGMIRELQDRTNDLYKAIQGDGIAAPPIRLELPRDGGIEHRQIRLLIDFRDRSGVVPGGYLSDSQIHTLTLALRLSAIRMLNSNFPIIVLDDVVTSYDVERRKNIARVIGERFEDFQIVLVTHDEQFFKMLPDHVRAGRWIFKRITDLDPEFGPRFDDYQTQDQAIESMLERNESAAVKMRMAEEEWLYRICIDFETTVGLLPPTRRHERSELANSLSSFIDGLGIELPRVRGRRNRFLYSLQRGVVENLGSHFDNSPYSSGSIGDERERWNEFKDFRDMFACSCGSNRFKRPRGLNAPVCKRCEKKFEFNETSAAQAQR